jgi:hypothetical protein
MIVSTLGNGDPARINFKMLSTDSLEKRSDPFCGDSILERPSTEDRVDRSMAGLTRHCTEKMSSSGRWIQALMLVRRSSQIAGANDEWRSTQIRTTESVGHPPTIAFF